MRRIYLLEQKGFPPVSEMKNMVVVAESEHQARHFAADRHATEISSIWTDAKTAECREIGIADGEVRSGVLVANMGIWDPIGPAATVIIIPHSTDAGVFVAQRGQHAWLRGLFKIVHGFLKLTEKRPIESW